MILRFSLLSVLLLASSSALPSCQHMTQATYERYHAHDKCNHAWQTSPELREERSARHSYIGATGQYPLIPAQKTVVCPLEPVDLTSPSGVIGQDTRWVVENKSLGRVVIAYLEDGVERSAMNGNITPPQADPRAILQPGEYKVVNTFEGHVFYVREVMEDGGTGDILLQHRPGVVEFTNRYGKELDCGNNDTDQDDRVEEEVVEQQNAQAPTSTSTVAATTSASNSNTDAMITKDRVISTENVADITQEQTVEPASVKEANTHPNQCNFVYQGFRNTLPNCPLDVYYVGTEEGTSDGPMQCQENFRFHLGNEVLDNAYDWEGRLKFEVTFIGHSFVARLASNPDIVVDSFTMKPTEIHDCPNRKQEAVIVDQVIEFNGVQHSNANRQNSTAQALDGVSVVLPCGNSTLMNGLSSQYELRG